MNQEIQEQFDKLFDLFLNEGWKLFKEEAQISLRATEEKVLSERLTEQDYNFLQGQITVLRNVVNYDEITNNNYEQLNQEETFDEEP